MEKLDFKINVTISDKLCPKHHVPLVSYGKIKPFCPKCQEEKTNQEKANMVKKFKVDQVHDYLANNSLLDRDESFGYTFDGFKTNHDAMLIKYKRAAEALAKDYAENPDKKFNSLFFGKSGTGKTHLAMSILNYVNSHSNQKCLFLSIPKLVTENRDWQADHTSSVWSTSWTAEKVSDADLVVVDDLGAESASGDATSFVQSVIFGIYEANQRVITTTNLNASTIRSTYDNRILSRISENAAGHILDFSKLKDHRPGLF